MAIYYLSRTGNRTIRADHGANDAPEPIKRLILAALDRIQNDPVGRYDTFHSAPDLYLHFFNYSGWRRGRVYTGLQLSNNGQLQLILMISDNEGGARSELSRHAAALQICGEAVNDDVGMLQTARILLAAHRRNQTPYSRPLDALTPQERLAAMSTPCTPEAIAPGTRDLTVLQYNVCWECMEMATKAGNRHATKNCGFSMSRYLKHAFWQLVSLQGILLPNFAECLSNAVDFMTATPFDVIAIQEMAPEVANIVIDAVAARFRDGGYRLIREQRSQHISATIIYRGSRLAHIGRSRAYSSDEATTARTPQRPLPTEFLALRIGLAQRFQILESRREFLFVNIHMNRLHTIGKLEAILDYIVRDMQAEDNLPIVVAGDFNMEFDTTARLLNRFTALNPNPTCCWDNDMQRGNIDQILVSGVAAVRGVRVGDGTPGAPWDSITEDMAEHASDHMPVAALMTL